MEEFGLDFIKENNQRILAGFPSYQPRYVHENREMVSKNELNVDERRFLAAVELHQFKLTITDIYKQLGFSAYKGTRVVKDLEKRELIKIIDIVKGKGVSKYPALLEPAYKLLNLPEKKFQGKGCGYEHLTWQHLIAEHFSEVNLTIELNKNGKCIDVGIQHDNKLIAFEVAMTSAHEKENIIKDIEQARADLVVIGCKDERVMKEVKEITTSLGEHMRQKVAIYLLSQIIKMDLKSLLGGK